jgi:hypothetical protein
MNTASLLRLSGFFSNSSNLHFRKQVLAFVVVSGMAGAQAQSTNSGSSTSPALPAPAGTANNPQNTQLQPVVVEAASPDATTLPIRPTDAVFGLDDTVQDTPRSVYQVSKLQLQFDPIRNATDLALYSPSISAVSSQGIAGVPYIRGFSAEVYQDGFLIGRSLRPFDATTSYQSLDIVTGPASVIYGPSSNTSGYLDWTTKAPLWDGNHTQVNLLFGTWDSGGQGGHPDFSQQVDNSGPISKDLAYRLVYTQNEADSYYQGAQNNFEHLYAALSWVPTKDISVDWNFDFGNYDYSLVRGYNRVTQDLIDNNQYLGGTATPILKNANGDYYEPISNSATGQTSATPGTGFIRVYPNSAGTPSVSNYYFSPAGSTTQPTIGAYTPVGAGTVEGFVLRPANATTSTIYPYIGTENPNDPAHLSQYIIEQKANFNVDADFQILNKSYYEHDDQSQQTFDDASLQGDQADIFENRTEIHLDNNYKLLGVDIEHKSNSGLDLRFVDDTTVFNVSNYLINPFDLTQPLSSLSLGQLYGVNNGVIFANKGSIATPAYGRIALASYNPITGFQAPISGPISPTTFESNLAEIGTFTYHEFKFNDQWTWSFGARGTLTFAHDTTPVQGSAASAVDDSTISIEPDITSSLSFKPIPWTTIYATYNFTQAYNTGNGAGGIAYGTANQIGEANLHSDSVLYETGAKFELIPDKLFASVAGYDQTRTLSGVATTGGFVFPRVESHGFESALNYQPDKNLSLGINYSWMEANYINYNPNSSFGSPYGVVADGTTVFSATTSSPTESKYPRGDYRVDLPKNRVDAFASYQFDWGLGFRGDFWVTDAYPLVNNVATIPAEFNIDLGVFYAQPKWRAQIDFLNVTDERNFALVNSTTAENIQPLEPFGIQGKFTYNF